MRRLFALALLFLSGPALASTYDDFSRGIDANNHGDADGAIQYFTRALEGGDLAPSYQPSALFGRARAYLHNRHCNAAHADLTQAIRLRSDFVDAYNLRAEANACLDREDAALADASAAIRLRPAAGYFFTRSRLLWNRGSFADARADADAAAARDPANAYFVLWSAVTALRAGGLDTQLFARQSTAPDNGWPRPLIDLFSARTTPDGVWRTVGTNPERRCEANFYVGEWYLARGESTTAKKLFETATVQCPRDYIAFDAATRELRRLSTS